MQKNKNKKLLFTACSLYGFLDDSMCVCVQLAEEVVGEYSSEV